MDELRVISAGAARNLLGRLAERPGREPRLRVTFGPVGVVEGAARREPAFDVVITSRVGLPALGALCAPGSDAEIGLVPTALALPTGAPTTLAPIDDEHELRELLLAAPALYCADLETSTAGRYVARLLAELGLGDRLRDRLRIYPEGAAALQALAALPADDRAADGGPARPLVIAQLTEIVATPGVSSRRLPSTIELTTSYVAAVGAHSARPEAARRLVALLTGHSTATIRGACGFAPPASPQQRI